MLKPVIVATAVLAIAGSSLVYAQQRYDGPGADGGPRFEHRHRPSAEDMAAYTDARIAALKAGLELTPDQAKNWPAFEQALREMAQLRVARMQAREAREQSAEPDADHAARAAVASGRQHEQGERCSQADRRRRRAALYEPHRHAEGAFHQARTHVAAASSSRSRLARRQWLRSRWRKRRSMVGTPWSSVRAGRQRPRRAALISAGDR